MRRRCDAVNTRRPACSYVSGLQTLHSLAIRDVCKGQGRLESERRAHQGGLKHLALLCQERLHVPNVRLAPAHASMSAPPAAMDAELHGQQKDAKRLQTATCLYCWLLQVRARPSAPRTGMRPVGVQQQQALCSGGVCSNTMDVSSMRICRCATRRSNGPTGSACCQQLFNCKWGASESHFAWRPAALSWSRRSCSASCASICSRSAASSRRCCASRSACRAT